MWKDNINFFISYARADRQWGEWIAWQLEEAGYLTELQAWDFHPGGNFVLDMDAATKSAERTIAILSPDYFTSVYTPSEWAVAFKQDPKGEKGIVLPVLVRECKQDLTGRLLSTITYINIVGLDEVTATEELLKGIQRSRSKPSNKPNFPLTNP